MIRRTVLQNLTKCLSLAFLLSSLAAVTGPAVGQGRVVIGEGSQIDTGSGQVGLGCASLTVAGLAAGQWSGIENVALTSSAHLETTELDFGGDWTAATFQDVPGQVHWREQCDRTEGSLLGNNRFASLAVSTSTGVLRRLDVDGEQTITESLRLIGGEMPLMLRSSVAGQAARLTVPVPATWSIRSVDVADIDSSGGQSLAPGDPANSQSQDSGGNSNWFLGAVALPIPLLGWPGLLLLLLTTLAIGWRRLAVGSLTSKTLQDS